MVVARKQGASWRSVELYACIAYAILYEGFIVWRSSVTSNEYSTGAKSGWLRGLRPGWIGGRMMDLSDTQWRNFRSGLPALIAVMAAFSILGACLRSSLGLKGKGMARFWLIASSVYVIYLHGSCVLFILAIALGNYVLTKSFAGTSAFPYLLWIYNLTFLVSNRVYSGYKFASFGAQFAFLDQHRGELRWHISFNMVMLRMLSFGLDYHWAQISRPSTVNWENHTRNCDLCTLEASGTEGASCYLSRQEKPVSESQYNLVVYLAYLLYAPLYIAGPIITFNAFASQLENPQRAYSKKDIAIYGLRWFLCFLLMEFLTHLCYFNALAISGVWQMLSPVEIFIIGYGVLNFMWLKFLLIWRFFRFWALIDGIETQENMTKCLNNCCDLETFWKSWHASYNRYLVRYLYIPLGGSRWRFLNVWIIFTFVAIWHDLEWRLLSWAWVTCILWGPELLAKSVMRTPQMAGFKKTNAYRECHALAGSLNITGLMLANLVGFVVGPDGMKLLASRMLSRENIPLLLAIIFSFYVGTKLMLASRDREERMKENKKQGASRKQLID